MVWTHGMEALQEFVNAANNLHPTIKLTHCTSFEHVHFLDTTVHFFHDHLQTEIYTKPTDAHQYLLPSSCHPRHVIKNIPKSLALRIRRVCSITAYFEKHAAQLTTYLVSRYYKAKHVKKALEEVRAIPRESLLTSPPKNDNERMPFITNYCPQFSGVGTHPAISAAAGGPRAQKPMPCHYDIGRRFLKSTSVD